MAIAQDFVLRVQMAVKELVRAVKGAVRMDVRIRAVADAGKAVKDLVQNIVPVIVHLDAKQVVSLIVAIIVQVDVKAVVVMAVLEIVAENVMGHVLADVASVVQEVAPVVI